MRAMVLVSLFLVSCASRQPITVEKLDWKRGPGWAAVEDKPGKWLILADDANATEAARKYICGSKYICIGPELLGEMSAVERLSK